MAHRLIALALVLGCSTTGLAEGRLERDKVIEILTPLLERAVPTGQVQPVAGAGKTIVLRGWVRDEKDFEKTNAVARRVWRPGEGEVVNELRIGTPQIQLEMVIAKVDREAFRRKHPDLCREHERQLGIIHPVTKEQFQAWVNLLRQLQIAGAAELAEPSVTSLSGRRATYISGGKVAVPQMTDRGMTMTYVPYGTIVNFLPVARADGRVYLEMEWELSKHEPTKDTVINGVVIPAIRRHRDQATVTVEPGQTLVTTSSQLQRREKPRWFGFFSETEERTEDMITFITSRVPLLDVQSQKVRPPRVQDDFELFLDGINDGPGGKGEEEPYLPEQYR